MTPTAPSRATHTPGSLGAQQRLESVLRTIGPAVIACSGGIDSLVLAATAHRRDARAATIAHAIAPAVPAAATARVRAYAARLGWDLRIVETAEIQDDRYLANNIDRCYHCKSHLYDALEAIAVATGGAGATILSGANLDDLDDYRPGLVAASEHGVRHPFVEARIDKAEIRRLAATLALPDADLPASPCLASRLYTGTKVTTERLRAVEAGEEVVRVLTGVRVVRCRLRGEQVHIEVSDADRAAITGDVVECVFAAMRHECPTIEVARLDDRPYGQGRAVLHVRHDTAMMEAH